MISDIEIGKNGKGKGKGKGTPTPTDAARFPDAPLT